MFLFESELVLTRENHKAQPKTGWELEQRDFARVSRLKEGEILELIGDKKLLEEMLWRFKW